MYATVESVKETTGYDVGLDLVRKAQAIIEAVTGRMESDVTSPTDKSLLGRATEFQAAYMSQNYATVYEQVSVAQIAQGESMMTYKAGDDYSPWVSPLAMVTLKKLSWKGSRSVHTGPIFDRAPAVSWETN